MNKPWVIWLAIILVGYHSWSTGRRVTKLDHEFVETILLPSLLWEASFHGLMLQQQAMDEHGIRTDVPEYPLPSLEARLKAERLRLKEEGQ